MKILVSNILSKELSKFFQSDKTLNIFLNKLKRQKPELIYLKRPYVKIKVSLFDISFRIIAKYDKNNDILVLIFVKNKTNKTFWENIFWNKDLEEKINFRIEKISDDIENNNYKLYE